ncbi:8-hydroxy-dADP phosphatase [Aureococcus anophagefferens]|nr:8-hydroxy-dADP phosphatase [Aureococcus anophagefferens]
MKVGDHTSIAFYQLSLIDNINAYTCSSREPFPEKKLRKWVQRGDDIDGEAAGDLLGYSVSLSADGTTLAVGAWGNDGAGSNAGHARVFAWHSDDETWVQRGDDIDGEAAGDNSGYSVSLSADGTALAVGAPGNDDGPGNDAGHARVFAWDYGDGPDCSTKRGRDSESWHRKDAPTKTCDWVERKPTKRCRKKGATGPRALTECVRACASCPPRACADDAAWSHINKKNKKLDCVSVARNAGRRCALPGAAAACKQTCGGC